MGTRGLTVVIMNEQHRVAQYGQWDHYPEGQGVKVLEFCRKNLSTIKGRKKFKAMVAKTHFIDDAELAQLWAKIGADTKSGFVTLAKSEEFSKKYPSLHHNTGAEILTLVLSGETRLQDSMEFINESLMCEWAYMINLDTGKLEVYKGFQDKPHQKGRYCGYVPEESSYSGDKYYAGALVAEFALNRLPTAGKFVAKLVPVKENHDGK